MACNSERHEEREWQGDKLYYISLNLMAQLFINHAERKWTQFVNYVLACVTGGIVGVRNKVLAVERLIASSKPARNIFLAASLLAFSGFTYNTASYAG